MSGRMRRPIGVGAMLAIASAGCAEEPKDPAPLSSGAGSLPTASVGASAQPTEADDGDADEDAGTGAAGTGGAGTGGDTSATTDAATGTDTTSAGTSGGTVGGGTLDPSETESHEDGMPPLTTTEIPEDDGLLPDATDG